VGGTAEAAVQLDAETGAAEASKLEVIAPLDIVDGGLLNGCGDSDNPFFVLKACRSAM